MKYSKLAVVLLSATLSLPLWAEPSSASQAAPTKAAEPAGPKPQLPLEELRTFADVFDRIKQAYVEPVDDRVLLENAIRGMLAELDPHSAYLEPEAFEDLQVNTSGEFGGLGIEVGMEDGVVKVITPIDDTPAQQAGVRAGDLIIKLDDKPVKGMSLSDAVKMMRGKPGSSVLLTILREGASKPLEIQVKRAVIQVQSVKSKMLEDGYGYLRITQFQVHSGEDVRKSIQKLKQDKSGLRGLVLDLRNNPGGVLQAAVDVADAFLEKGLIVYTKGRVANSEMRFTATPGDDLAGLPVIVLINGGSASASEIVAGALQDQKRAVLMGTTSFGKGSVQTVLPLNNSRALKLTTARYYTPNGRSIQAQGIVPDIKVEMATITRVAGNDGEFKEADLRGHLENQVKAKEAQSEGGKEGGKTLAEQDYQLYEALNMLKAMAILGRK